MIIKLTLNFRTSTPKTGNKESRSVKSNNRLYEKPVGISKKRKDDLMKFCKKGYIPKHHHGFYEILKCNDENDQDDVFTPLNTPHYLYNANTTGSFSLYSSKLFLFKDFFF